MDIIYILKSFITPPIPFFFLGLLAAWVKSDLEVPGPVAKFISLYLLLAIGFKGGVELHHSGISGPVIATLFAATLMAVLIPLYMFFILKRKLDIKNAAALAAAYGSVSVVTFVTAGNILHEQMIDYGGEMVAALALMESPAIIIGVWLARKYSENEDHEHHSMKEILKEAFFNGSILVLIGSLIFGFLSNDKGMEVLSPFTEDLFKGMLAFFLLDMGVIAGKQMKPLFEKGIFLVAMGVLLPMLNAVIAMFISKILGLPVGGTFMFTVLCASASYVAVPAAMRIALPEANPGIYVSMALAVTFPFNIIVGLPLYLHIITHYL